MVQSAVRHEKPTEFVHLMRENVEVIPPAFGPTGADPAAAEEAKKLQRHRWKVLVGTFLLVFAGSMIWIWSRPAIYQSQAIIHFSYPQQLGQELSTIPVEQITLNQQRLTSFRVLESVSEQLRDARGLQVSPEQLSNLLSTEAQTESRIINLYATGQDAGVLHPVLSEWLNLYLAMLNLETVSDTAEELDIGADKLASLEAKIIDQRLLVEAFAEQHNIVSIERDENRTLNKITGLSASLDQADAELAASIAQLAAVENAEAQGEVLTHPDDAVQLNEIRSQIRALQVEMADLAERYTPEYMNLDPEIVGKQRALEKLQQELLTLEKDSQRRYTQESRRAVETARQNGDQLNQQLLELNKQAQEFNKQLSAYDRELESLSQLEEQAQILKNQMVEKEVQRPFEARINVLEEPFVPQYPIGPAYLRDSMIAFGAATAVAIGALLLFSFVVRQKQPAATLTSYTVVPPRPALNPASDPALTLQQQAQLGMQAPQARLEQTGVAEPVAQPLRLISREDCQHLYAGANRIGKVAIALSLNGVSPSELQTMPVSAVDLDNQCLHVPGSYARTLVLPPAIAGILQEVLDPALETIWPEHMDLHQLDQLMVNAAHDAGLAFPEQFSVAVLRHCYLTYLVTQGARLNDLEQVAGYINPAELGQYRSVNRRGDAVELSELQTGFPLDW